MPTFMERTKDLHLKTGITTSKTMKLSTFTLGALLAGTLSTEAQTPAKNPIPADTASKAKSPKAQINEKYHQSKIAEEIKKDSGKKHNQRYCPTCGRG